METFQLALFPFFSFDAAKLLRHTAKTCQYLRKKTKKVHFLHFFSKICMFCYFFCIFIGWISGRCLYHTVITPNPYRTFVEGMDVLFAIHLIGLFCFLAEYLYQFFGFTHANVGAMCSQFLNEIQCWSNKVLKKCIPMELPKLFL